MVGAILTWTSSACGDDLLPIGLQKQLLADDDVISEMQNVTRSTGRATKRGVVLEAGGEWGHVTTKPFRLDGDTLEVNIDASEGGFLVEVLDADNQPYVDSAKKQEFDWDNNRIFRNVDGLRLQPRWRGDRNLESLVGKVVRLRFRLRNANLYAFQIKSED